MTAERERDLDDELDDNKRADLFPETFLYDAETRFVVRVLFDDLFQLGLIGFGRFDVAELFGVAADIAAHLFGEGSELGAELREADEKLEVRIVGRAALLSHESVLLARARQLPSGTGAELERFRGVDVARGCGA